MLSFLGPYGTVLLTGLWLGACLATALHVLEHPLKILPRWVFLEVAAGVILTLGTVELTIRINGITDMTTAMRMIWVGFVATGLPTTIWQLWIYRTGNDTRLYRK